MGDRVGYQRDNSQQDVRRTTSRSNFRKPPSGPWHPTVPSWEKKFCSACLIPWKKLCETKKVMDLYKNIVQWNDSAGEEAFQNAKNRFWAAINGLPCDISLPDPDIYIDDVDWNSYIDPELLSDLDRKPPIPDDGEKVDGILFLDSALSNRLIPCTGWDDADDPVIEVQNSAGTGWGNYDRKDDNADVWGHSGAVNRIPDFTSRESGRGDCNINSNNRKAWESGSRGKKAAVNNSMHDGWGQREDYDRNADNSDVRGQSSRNDGWGQWENYNRNADNSDVWGHSREENRVAEDNSWEWESGWQDCTKNANNSHAWDSRGREKRVAESNLWDNGWGRWESSNVKEADNSEARKNGGYWRTGVGNNYRKREWGGRYASRHNDNTSRFQGNYCQMNRWKNGGGRKRTNFVYEKPVINKRPLASWQWISIKSCGPMYHDKSAQSGNTCSWDKPVS